MSKYKYLPFRLCVIETILRAYEGYPVIQALCMNCKIWLALNRIIHDCNIDARTMIQIMQNSHKAD